MEVNTPFYSGKLEALVMPSLLYDLIIGNVLGARGPCDPDPLFAETAAVETRSQMQKSSKGVKPLVTPAQREGTRATPEDLKKAQREDESLVKLFELAGREEEKEVRGGTAQFHIKRGLLYPVFTSFKMGRSTSQLVVPTNFRETVMSTGQEALTASHLGKGKTAERIMSSFFWPRAMADVKRFCVSCDMCKKMAPKGMVRKVLLQNPPLIDTFFRRVAIDLIGPISPA